MGCFLHFGSMSKSRPFSQWVYFVYDIHVSYIIYINICMVVYLKIRVWWFPAFTISCWFVRVCLIKPDISPFLACTNITCCRCAFQASGWHALSQGHFTLSKIARTDFPLSKSETMFQRFFGGNIDSQWCTLVNLFPQHKLKYLVNLLRILRTGFPTDRSNREIYCPNLADPSMTQRLLKIPGFSSKKGATYNSAGCDSNKLNLDVLRNA